MTDAAKNARALEGAIRALFVNPSMGAAFLELPRDATPEKLPEVMADRVAGLETTLTDYVVQLAAELEELGEDERPRLEAEARATLIAIREVRRWLRE